LRVAFNGGANCACCWIVDAAHAGSPQRSLVK
jgi:hypothetical protein